MTVPVFTVAQTWSPVGEGCGSAVYALEVFNGSLYAGGTFTTAGGVNANYLARWNSGTWTGVPGLITYLAADGLYAHDTALYIGDAGRVKRYNGSTWYTYPGVFNTALYSMAFHQDTLYVGGAFSSSNSVPYPHVARWNGNSYDNLTSGCNSQVTNLVPFEGRLFVGGNFTVAGDSLINHAAQWDGTAWHRMGAGVNDDIFAHCIFQDTLYIGGRFTQANGQPASRVAKWNGTQWVRVGGTLNDYVTSIAVYKDQLYIAGAFTSPSRVARLSGNTWVPLGVGVDATARTLEVYNDTLFVGGSFLNAGGQPALRIAKWHVPDAPTAQFTSSTSVACEGGCITFTDASTNGPLIWAWSCPGGVPATSDLPVPTVCYANAGSYDVSLVVTNAGGTGTAMVTDMITVEVCTGLDAGSTISRTTLTPNPANGSVRVQLAMEQNEGSLYAFDLTGRSMERRRFTGNVMDLDTHQWPSGTYIIEVRMALGTERHRLIQR